MHRNSTTMPQVNKVKILFTKRQMTAYGGFTLLASFFQRIGLPKSTTTFSIGILGLPNTPWWA
jgi:hypothetical protein